MELKKWSKEQWSKDHGCCKCLENIAIFFPLYFYSLTQLTVVRINGLFEGKWLLKLLSRFHSEGKFEQEGISLAYIFQSKCCCFLSHEVYCDLIQAITEFFCFAREKKGSYCYLIIVQNQLRCLWFSGVKRWFLILSWGCNKEKICF